MSSTNTKSLADARNQVSAGTPDFSVLSAHEENGVTHFLISVPQAVLRSGLFGPLAAAIGSNGKATKFGDDVFNALCVLNGVEPNLDNRSPHTISLYVTTLAMDEPPMGFFHQSLGLPGSVCVAIQAAILRNRSLVQRGFEYLRRLF